MLLRLDAVLPGAMPWPTHNCLGRDSLSCVRVQVSELAAHKTLVQVTQSHADALAEAQEQAQKTARKHAEQSEQRAQLALEQAAQRLLTARESAEARLREAAEGAAARESELVAAHERALGAAGLDWDMQLQAAVAAAVDDAREHARADAEMKAQTRLREGTAGAAARESELVVAHERALEAAARDAASQLQAAVAAAVESARGHARAEAETVAEARVAALQAEHEQQLASLDGAVQSMVALRMRGAVLCSHM